MSSGATHVCRRMGIADAIAITTIMTAKNFAMTLRASRLRGHYLLAFGHKLKASLLCLEREIHSRRLAGSYSYLLALRSIFLLPCGHGVTSRGQAERVRTIGVAD